MMARLAARFGGDPVYSVSSAATLCRRVKGGARKRGALSKFIRFVFPLVALGRAEVENQGPRSPRSLFARIRRILFACAADVALGAGFARPPAPLSAPRAASGRPTPHGRRPQKIGGVGARAPPRAE